jgi:hypothetical protein
LVRDWKVLAIQAAVGWCLGGLGPALIIGARDLAIPRYELSWLGSAFGFTLLGTGLVGGRVLRRGPMPVARAGSVLLIAGVMLLGTGDRLWLLGAGALLQGAGCSAFVIATPALIGIENRAHRLAAAVGVSSIAGLLAPAAVAIADQLPSTGRIALLLPTLWLLPVVTSRSTHVAGPGPLPPVMGAGRMTAGTWKRWTIIVLGVSAEFCFWTWGAARLVDGGASDSTASGLAAAFAIGMAVGRMAGPRSLRSLGPVQLSALVTSVAAVIFITNAGLVVLVVGMMLAGLGIAVLYPVCLALILEDPNLSETRLIALAAYASGVAITVTPTLLGLLDRIMEIQYAFGLVPLLMGAVVWLMRAIERGAGAQPAVRL